MLFEYMAQVRPGLPKQILTELYCPITLFLFRLQGDLHEFLVAHSPAGDGSVSGIGAGSDDGTASTLEQSDFLYIAIQIAAGTLLLPL